MDAQLATMEKSIHAAAGRAFNLGSPKQLREILFDELKLPVQKRTGTTGEPSTDFETLEKLAAMGHELPRLMIEHRSVAKLKGTYVDALPALVNPNTGRVHTSFNQTVAATGRLSSSDPNLQNIPTRTEQGKQIRQAFVPPDGWRIVTADYSQVELRLLAHFCKDERLVEAFAADRDVHASVAAEIFKVPEAEVTSAQRRVAKTVNFGVIYGMSAHGLAVRLGMPRKEADRFIDDYFARFPKVLAYQDDLLTQARKTGLVGTLLGRRRRFDPAGIRPQSSYQNRTAAEREAINMEIQGSAADLMKLAMLGVHRRLTADKYQAKMLLTVHDELVFEAPPAEVPKLAAMVRAEMSGAMTLSVPLKVDVAAGPNWLAVDDVP
jgi:DNA polymerase-1